MGQMHIFGPKMQFLAQNPFFLEIIQIFCYHHDWTPKRQHFCVDPVARRARAAAGPIFGPFFGPDCPKWPFLGVGEYSLQVPLILDRL